MFYSLFHLLPLTLNDCTFVISISSSGYKPAMDVKDIYIMPVDLDLYSMLLLKKKEKIFIWNVNNHILLIRTFQIFPPLLIFLPLTTPSAISRYYQVTSLGEVGCF